MKPGVPPLKWLQSFEAAARHTSFRAAADELGLTQPAVSYQIRSLETQLGFPLFERRPRNLCLTDMGHAYLPSVRKAFDELHASTSGLFGLLGEKSVTIRVAISFAVLCLAPRLKRFREAYPTINIGIWSAIWANALEDHRADLDIRFGDGMWPGYKATRLTRERAVPVCSPDFLARLDAPVNLAALARHEVIQIAGQDDLWIRALQSSGSVDPAVGGGYKVDTSLSAAELAASGMGCAILLNRFARPYFDAGRLVIPVNIDLPLKRSHHLLVPENHERTRPEVLLLRDWLLEEDWS